MRHINEIKDHVPSLSTCEKMLDLGFDVRTIYVWVQPEEGSPEIILRDDLMGLFGHGSGFVIAPAPLATEIPIPKNYAITHEILDHTEVEIRALAWIEETNGR